MKGVCNDKKISRGEIYVADLNPYQGSEQGGIRPVVILQNDAGNYFSSTTIVASLTPHVAKKENLPTHVFINSREDLEDDSIIMCEQIRTIDKSRLIRCLGRLDEYEMEKVEEALSVRLGCFDDSLSINVDNPIYFENIRFFFLRVENRTCHWHWIRFFLIIIFTFTWSIGYTSFIYPCKKVGYLFFPMFKCLYNIIIC
ncbi:type II toxin-antitoxin system PemK/MazF family toxin [Faecalibacillus intestinalis]|uniref:type II toxin-antitoxin system PemK/MazF family toxin n=1 Tax=Faecalibacillus intestinalis TaxID=1982626 RepID=UPI003F94FE6C